MLKTENENDCLLFSPVYYVIRFISLCKQEEYIRNIELSGECPPHVRSCCVQLIVRVAHVILLTNEKRVYTN